jgi:hypothetical protein
MMNDELFSQLLGFSMFHCGRKHLPEPNMDVAASSVQSVPIVTMVMTQLPSIQPPCPPPPPPPPSPLSPSAPAVVSSLPSHIPPPPPPPSSPPSSGIAPPTRPLPPPMERRGLMRVADWPSSPSAHVVAPHSPSGSSGSTVSIILPSTDTTKTTPTRTVSSATTVIIKARPIGTRLERRLGITRAFRRSRKQRRHPHYGVHARNRRQPVMTRSERAVVATSGSASTGDTMTATTTTTRPSSDSMPALQRLTSIQSIPIPALL